MTVTAAVTPHLERSVPFEVTRSTSEGGDGLTFEGYAAVFNTFTRIDSWEGMFDEQIAPGAFRKTIRERTPVLQFDHGRHAVVGSIPIGAIRELREDERGLFVQARLSNNWLVEPVREAIANGSISGMSFRFEVVKEDWYDKNGKRITDLEELMGLLWSPGDRGPLQRTLREVKCPELGPVVFPAYAETSASVRARAVAVARTIADDDQLVRSLRRSLVIGQRVELPDEESATEVARALLFGDSVPDAAAFTVQYGSTATTGSAGTFTLTPTRDGAAPDDSETRASAESQDAVATTADCDCQDDSVMIQSSDVARSIDDTEEDAGEPPAEGHSETRDSDEPPAEGHSETAPPPTFADARTTPSFLEIAQAEERRLARQHRAAAIRAQHAAASARAERYSDG